MVKTRTTKLAILAAAVAATALTVAPASGSNKPNHFGSNLNKHVQPSNAGPAHKCEIPGQACTWTMGEAYGAPGREGAPYRGKIRKLKLIAAEPGKFRLQIVKLNKLGDVKLMRNGPKIHYQGQQGYGGPPSTYRVEKFPVNVKVKKGERLAIKTRKTSALRCSSGGPNNLQHTPALKVGEKRTWDETDGCWLLLEAKVK